MMNKKIARLILAVSKGVLEIYWTLVEAKMNDLGVKCIVFSNESNEGFFCYEGIERLDTKTFNELKSLSELVGRHNRLVQLFNRSI